MQPCFYALFFMLLLALAPPAPAIGLSERLRLPVADTAATLAPAGEAPAAEQRLPESSSPPAAIDLPEAVGQGSSGLSAAMALREVWDSNPAVLEAEKTIESAGFALRGSYGGFLPSLTVSNATGRNALSSVQASLPLWSGGLTLAQIDSSKAREVLARANLDRVKLMLGTQTLTAFYNLAQAQEQLLQWRKYLAALERLRATVLNRATLGVAPQSELQTALSRIQQAEVGQEAARLQLEVSRTELGRLLRRRPVAVQWQGAPDTDLDTLSALDPQALVDRHPDVLIAAAQLADQSALQRQARAQLYPEIAVQYRHYYSGQEFDATADAPQLVVQYQVGNGYGAYQRAKAEQSKVESARAHLEVAQREALAALLSVRQQAASSARQLGLQQQASDNTQALVDSFLRQYQVGRRSWIEVLNAQREAHENALGLINSHRAARLSAQQLRLQSLAWAALLGETSGAAAH